MKKIVISTSTFNNPLQQNAIHHLEKHGFELVFNPFGRRCTSAEVVTLLDDKVVGLIAGTEPLTREVLSGAKQLKIISRCGSGLDNVDLAATKALGIDVYSTPIAPVIAVAELTIGLMLCLLRKIAICDRTMRQGSWLPVIGNLLSHQTIGILGFGQIGQKVVSLIRTFGPKVLIYDPHVSKAGDERFVDLDYLLKNASLVSCHFSGTKENVHFFDEDKFVLMQKGGLLVNTARGSCLDEAALYNNIVSGRIAGAALDVFRKEPYEGPLLNLPTVLLTPHIGSFTWESRKLMESEAMMNLLKGLHRKGLLLDLPI